MLKHSSAALVAHESKWVKVLVS